jgi:hypothetical protein
MGWHDISIAITLTSSTQSNRYWRHYRNSPDDQTSETRSQRISYLSVRYVWRRSYPAVPNHRAIDIVTGVIIVVVDVVVFVVMFVESCCNPDHEYDQHNHHTIMSVSVSISVFQFPFQTISYHMTSSAFSTKAPQGELQAPTLSNDFLLKSHAL